MDSKIHQIINIFAEAFEISDEDENGTLSMEEFSSMLAKKNVMVAVSDLGLTVKDMNLLFSRIDIDQSGTLSLQELVNGVLKFKIEMTGHEEGIKFLRRAFGQVLAASPEKPHGLKISKTQFMDFVRSPKIVDKMIKSGIGERDLDDLWSAAKQVGGEDRKSMYVSEEALVAGFIDLNQEKGNAIRGMNFVNNVFLVADLDGSGQLTKKEVLNLLNRSEVHAKLRSLRLSIPDWNEIYDQVDVDGDGELNWDEVRTAMSRIWTEGSAAYKKSKNHEDEKHDDDNDEGEEEEELEEDEEVQEEKIAQEEAG